MMVILFRVETQYNYFIGYGRFKATLLCVKKSQLETRNAPVLIESFE